MVRRSLVGSAVGLFVITGLAMAPSLLAAPLPEPEPWVWQQVTRYGGSAIRGAQVFAIGAAAYVVSGMPDNSIPHHEVWKYDSPSNSWTHMSDYPGTPIIEGVGFSIGNVGYICLGNPNVTAGLVVEFWQYNPEADTWAREADFPGAARAYAIGLSVGGKGYVAFGLLGYTNPLPLVRDVWEYDPADDAWASRGEFAATARIMATGFVLGSCIYYGLGNDSTTRNLRDLWRTRPIVGNP